MKINNALSTIMFALGLAALTGCGWTTWPVYPTDAAPIMSDAAADAAPVPDAAPEARVQPVLIITNQSMGNETANRGEPDARILPFALDGRSPEIRRLRLRVEGVTTGDHVYGSRGGASFGGFRLGDTDSGATMMGPIDLPRGEAYGRVAEMELTDGFQVVGLRHLMVTFKVAQYEDEVGELFDGTHQFRVTIGTAEQFAAADAITLSGAPVDPSLIVGNHPISATFTLGRSGSLRITHNVSTGQIIVPEMPTAVDQFNLHADLEGSWMAHARLRTRGDSASYQTVGVLLAGLDHVETCTLPTGVDQSCDIVLPEHQFLVPEGQDRMLWVIATAAPIGGAARSGAPLAVTLEADFQGGTWDGSYRNRFNAQFIGERSTRGLYVDGSTVFGTNNIVRRAKPTFAPQMLGTTTLFNGVVGLARFVEGVEGQSLAQAGFTFDVRIHRAPGSQLEIRGFEMWRGHVQMTHDQILFLDGRGSEIGREVGHTLGQTSERELIGASFVDPIILSGSGQQFQLQAEVTGSVPGDSITVSLVDTRSPVVTGSLSAPRLGMFDGLPFQVRQLDCSGMPCSALTAQPWSDLSETPHGSASVDWTNEWGLGDALTPLTWTITR